MISLTLAQQLKAAGLVWHTNNYDFFAIPDRELDDRVFVLADMMAYTELVQGWPVVAFHGTAEWALDYILTREVVWMPTEEQLREALEAGRVTSEADFALHLAIAEATNNPRFPEFLTLLGKHGLVEFLPDDAFIDLPPEDTFDKEDDLCAGK